MLQNKSVLNHNLRSAQGKIAIVLRMSQYEEEACLPYGCCNFELKQNSTTDLNSKCK